MNQCFIISLPRSGSTLLQRLLAGHPRIKTVGEPWLALPFAYALREKGVRAEYGHRSMSVGMNEFVHGLPGGAAAFYREAGRMLDRLHVAMGEGREWFLDKTPRYFLMLDELRAMFPDAKFIVLQRNPLAVVASILTTWHDGRFRPKSNEIDIYEGPRRIARFVRETSANILEVRFEDLVAEPAKHLKTITDFLALPPLESVSLAAGDSLKEARLGDKTGVHRFSEVSAAPVESWKASFASPIRKRWARRYLDWLGDETLAALGYDRAALQRDLAAAPFSLAQAAGDLFDFNVRLLPLYCAPRLDFVRRDGSDARPRYRWKPSF